MTFTQPFRSAATALAVMATMMLPGASSAQTYPDRPVTLIVPYAPGGITDILARQFAQHLETSLGKPVVVENHAGASGTLGVGVLAKAAPDGHTIGLLGMSAMTLVPVLDSTLSYDPLVDIAPIGIVANVDTVLTARKDLPADTLEELVKIAKENPGKFHYGTAGAGGVSNLMMEDLKSALGLDIVFVPYQGDGPVQTALLSGELDLGFGAISSAASFVASDQNKALAVGGAERSKTLPDTPTLRESGLDRVIVNWSALGAPKGTPPEIMAILNRALNEAVAVPEFQSWMDGQGMSVGGGSPDDLTESIKSNMERFEAVVTNLKLDRK